MKGEITALDLTKDEYYKKHKLIHESKYNCGIISPLMEYLFYENKLVNNLNVYQKRMGTLYEDYRNKKFANKVYLECVKYKAFLEKFIEMAMYLNSKGYAIYGINSIDYVTEDDSNDNNKEINYIEIEPDFPTTIPLLYQK